VSRDVKFKENLASRKSQDLLVVVEGPQGVELKAEPRVETSSAGEPHFGGGGGAVIPFDFS
jgi:hypothetical protein